MYQDFETLALLMFPGMFIALLGYTIGGVVTSSDSTIRSLSPSPAVVMEVRNGFRVRMIVQKINVLVTKLKREFLPVYF